MKPLLLLMLLLLSPLSGLAAAPRLALFDFCNVRGKASPTGAKLALMLLPELGSYRHLSMIERRELDQVIREQRLAQTGLTPTQYQTLARILKADYLVTGRIYSLAEQQIINLKLIDCKTGGVTGKAFFFAAPIDDWTPVVRQLADYIAEKLSPR